MINAFAVLSEESFVLEQKIPNKRILNIALGFGQTN